MCDALCTFMLTSADLKARLDKVVMDLSYLKLAGNAVLSIVHKMQI